ncbi:MAG: hypothetical protein ACI4UM_09010 [Succinivibrio sp.]
MKSLPPNVYLHSYLQKAGVRFSLNVVDTMCKKGFGISFYLLLILSVLLTLCYCTDNISLLKDKAHFMLLYGLVNLYLFLYIVRVLRYRHIRRHLREDDAPIIVESYAVVLLDLSQSNPEKTVKPKKYAVLYKECGSRKPRFFTGAVKNGTVEFNKEQIARVFIDRKNERYYTVDDDKFYKTVSEKLKKGEVYSLGKMVSKLNSVSDRSSLDTQTDQSTHSN